MTDCACVPFSGDFEAATVQQIEARTARKPHTCCECGREISAGEKYEHVRALCDGTWFTEKTCADCLSVRNEFFCEGYLYGGVWKELREHIHACVGEISELSISRLTPKARDLVCEQIEDAWDWFHPGD